MSIAGDPEMVAAARHHERIGGAIDAVTKALGGSKTMHIVQMPDGSYVAKEMDSTPGERWSRIAKAALSGAAAGFAHGQGPGGGARAFSAGAATGLAMPQADQDRTTQKAEELESQRQKGMLFAKNMAMLDIQVAKGNLDLLQSPIKFAAEMAQYADTRRKSVSEAHGVHLATYANAKELSDHMQTNQELMDKHVGKGGTLVQIPQFSNGQMTGIEVYAVPEDTLNQYIDSDQQVLLKNISPDGKSIETKYRTYKKGQALWKDVIADQKSQDALNSATDLNFAKLGLERQRTDAETLRAETEQKESISRIAKNYADIAKAKADTDEWKATGDLDPNTGIPLVADKHGNARPMKLPEGVSAIKGTTLENFKNKYQAPALKAEETYNMLKQFDANVQAGKVNPVEQRNLMRIGMQIAAGASATTGTGGRGGMSNTDFRAALGARGLAEDKINLIEKLLNGAQITKTQSADVVEAYNAFRRSLWREAVTVGAVSHIGKDIVVPATVAGREKIIGENYAVPGQAQPVDTSQAARSPGAVQAIPQPPNATQKVPGSDGNWHWSDGKADLGIAGKM